LISDTTEISIDEFYQNFNSLYNNQKSYLVVFNTIKTSITFYEKLKKESKFDQMARNGKFFYLSTGIVPVERSRRIRIIKNLLDKKLKILIVSTQLVEAGVDIDLNVVIRDIGPIDSVIQIAGRCNRGMGSNRGKVFIVHLTDGNTGYAKHVYGAKHYAVSIELLNGKSMQENQFFDLINRYFAIVKKSVNLQISEDIWEAVKKFRFYTGQVSPKSVSDFRLIKEKYDYVDVFVESDEDAKVVFKEYRNRVICEKNLNKRQEAFLEIRNQFKGQIISVPKQLTVGLNEVTKGLLYLENEKLNTYYSKDTGFIRIEPDSFIF